jgi:hypothetical protein
MRLAFPGSNDVLDANASYEQCIANQRTMASPGHSLGTHQHAALARRQFQHLLNVLCELRRFHVIRVTAKREILPAGVDGIVPRVTQSAQTQQMRIANIERAQRFAEGFAIELRIVTRSRHGPYIEYAHNVIGFEQIDESVERPIRVPDRADKPLVQFGVASRRSVGRRRKGEFRYDLGSKANATRRPVNA